MNLRRARSPEERPSTNTSVGRIEILDLAHELVQKTDREGFVETRQYHELRRFATEALDWTASKRIELVEHGRRRQRREATQSLADARERLSKAVAKLPPRSRDSIQKPFEQFDRAAKKQLTTLLDEIQIYRTLSTVGTTTAVFAHEAAKPVGQITKLVDEVVRRAKRILASVYEEEPSDLLGMNRRAASALDSYAKLPLDLLQHNKRRPGSANIGIVVANIVALLKPFLTDARIETSVEARTEEVLVFASVASLESVVANLLINCVNAFTNAEGGGPQQRRIIVRYEATDKTALLTVLDNGPGLRGIRPNEIWLPGRTTIPGGTGLGLTIVRDTIGDLGGEVTVKSPGELGGAEFAVVLPRLGAT